MAGQHVLGVPPGGLIQFGIGLQGRSARLLPLGVRYALISGGLDGIVPASFAAAFAASARHDGEEPRILTIGQAGHFELIDPRSRAWKKIIPELLHLAE